MLSSDGSVNPLRQLATVTPITTTEWRGITSAGVSASFDSEAQEVSDDSPTLAQPTIKVERADAFIPYSFELGQDYPGFQQEIGKLSSLLPLPAVPCTRGECRFFKVRTSPGNRPLAHFSPRFEMAR